MVSEGASPYTRYRSKQVEDDALHTSGTNRQEKVSFRTDDQIRNNSDDMTILSQLIWKRDWGSALARLKEFPEESTRESSGLGFYSGLPLHLACTVWPLPPVSFVKSLILANPEACGTRQPTWGMLPLHLAADLSFRQRQASGTAAKEKTMLYDLKSGRLRDELTPLESKNQASVIRALIDAFPGSVHERENSSGMTPLHIAASTAPSENGLVSPSSSAVLRVLIEASPSTKEMGDGYGDSPVTLAWRQATFCCFGCGNRSQVPCSCKTRLSVDINYLHPLMTDEIQSVAIHQTGAPGSRGSAGASVVLLDDSQTSVGEETRNPNESNRTIRGILKDRREGHRERRDESREGVPKFVTFRGKDDVTLFDGTRDGSDGEGLVGTASETTEALLVRASRLMARLAPENTREGHAETTDPLPLEDCDTDSDSDSDDDDDDESIRAPPAPRLGIRPAETDHGLSLEKLAGDSFAFFRLSSSPGRRPPRHGGILRCRIRAWGLQRPVGSKSPRKPPSPCFDLLVSDGVDAHHYRSYPLRNTREGTWDDALLDLKWERSKAVPAASDASAASSLGSSISSSVRTTPKDVPNWQIRIRVLHCKKSGGPPVPIGACRTTFDLAKEERRLPLLHGFQVMGWIEIAELSLE